MVFQTKSNISKMGGERHSSSIISGLKNDRSLLSGIEQRKQKKTKGF
jgi:hypothetical protein